MPSVQKAHQGLPARDVVILTVALDGEASAVRHYLDEHRFTMPAAHDAGMAFARKIQVRGVPTTVIIDRRRNIAATAFGPLELDRPDMRKLIRSLVAEIPR